MIDPSNDEAAIPAATLILLREPDGGAPEVLMVERSRAMRFAGGALVFPGGRIDAGDVAMATALGDAALAQRLAALRETIEEAGVPVGLSPMSAVALATMRARLHGGAAIGEVVDAAAINLSALVPFARWRPDLPAQRVFDTHFFVARLSDGASEPLVDATENVRAFWTTPAAALAAAGAGEAQLIFPTRRVLERLATFGSVAAALASAAAWPIRTITPWVERRGGIDHLCIPDDLGYPVTSEPMADVRRG